MSIFDNHIIFLVFLYTSFIVFKFVHNFSSPKLKVKWYLKLNLVCISHLITTMAKFMNISKIFIFVVLYHFSDSYNILVVTPLPVISHSILGNAFVKILLNARHKVCVKKTCHSKHKQWDVTFLLLHCQDVSPIIREKFKSLM